MLPHDNPATPAPSSATRARSPSFLRRQEPTHQPPTPRKFIPPPPPFRGEVRWGVRSTEPPPERVYTSTIPTPNRHPCVPSPPPLRPIPVIPAQAGIHAPQHPRHSRSVIPAQAGTHASNTYPKKIHPSPLLGGRLGGGWKAPSRHQSVFTPPPSLLPTTIPAPLQPPPLRPPRHSCAGRNQATSTASTHPDPRRPA